MSLTLIPDLGNASVGIEILLQSVEYSRQVDTNTWRFLVHGKILRTCLCNKKPSGQDAHNVPGKGALQLHIGAQSVQAFHE